MSQEIIFSSGLFTPAVASEMDESLQHNCLQIKDIFKTISGSEVTLSLYGSCIMVSVPQPNATCFVGHVPLSFDLKFEVLFEQQKNVNSTPIGIRLFLAIERAVAFYISTPAVVEKWRARLSKKLNQRGFHQMFKPIRKLGSGNFASVYEVERFTDKAKFAVKAFSKNNTFSAKNGKESLINELTVLRQMCQNNILKLEAVYESDNSIYVVMELLTGDQFFKKIQERKGAFTIDEVRLIMRGLLSGLEHMHGRRIMHRDLKPENIMLRSQDSLEPVIVDFGLATPCDIDPYLFFRCGTPGYVAPEIVELREHKHIEPQCDIFSVGVIFHILLVRRPLFEGTHYEEVYRRNREMAFNLDSDVYKSCDPEAMNLLKAMLVKDWTKRLTATQALAHPFFTAHTQNMMQDEMEMAKSPYATDVVVPQNRLLRRRF